MSFPATYNINYYKGDNYQFVIRPKTSAGDPFPISSTTHNTYFRISTSRGGSAEDTEQLTSNIVDGNVVATIQPSDNVGQSSTSYFYDISVQKKSDAEEVYTLLTGTISVTKDITDPS
jgi:hypothetical protein